MVWSTPGANVASAVSPWIWLTPDAPLRGTARESLSIQTAVQPGQPTDTPHSNPLTPPPETPTPSTPLVLVHGLWDTPRLFHRLQRQLAGRRPHLLIPHLPQRFGLAPVLELASQLDAHIAAQLGAEQPVDVLGFSMGGVVARTWIQLLAGHLRTRRFISVGSPHQGTLTAGPWPGWPLAGVADVKPNSALLQQLDCNLHTLKSVECASFYCSPDLMVIPARSALLPLGCHHRLPVIGHHQLLRHPAALAPLVQELLRP